MPLCVYSWIVVVVVVVNAMLPNDTTKMMQDDISLPGPFGVAR